VTEEAFVAARARVEAEGIAYRGPDLGVERSIYLRDPDGVQIELVAVPLLDTNFT
jgi:glyoxylase I family protein